MKTAIITGGAGGIGSQAAKHFAKNNWNVVISYNHSKDTAEELTQKINSSGGSAVSLKCDVSQKTQTDFLVSEAIRIFGSVDALINNAGIAQQKLFTDITENDFDTMFNVNVKGVFNCCQSVLPHMINKKRGKIVNISSIWGVTGASCEVHYSASKAAVIGLTKALAKEVGPSSINVNCICPGVIDTKMNSCFDENTMGRLCEETPLCRIGSAEEVAKSIYFLCSDDTSFITGQVLNVDGGMIV